MRYFVIILHFGADVHSCWYVCVLCGTGVAPFVFWACWGHWILTSTRWMWAPSRYRRTRAWQSSPLNPRLRTSPQVLIVAFSFISIYLPWMDLASDTISSRSLIILLFPTKDYSSIVSFYDFYSLLFFINLQNAGHLLGLLKEILWSELGNYRLIHQGFHYNRQCITCWF